MKVVIDGSPDTVNAIKDLLMLVTNVYIKSKKKKKRKSGNEQVLTSVIHYTCIPPTPIHRKSAKKV